MSKGYGGWVRTPATYGGGYQVADLDSMGGDEIRSLTYAQLRDMRAEALADAKRALERLQRATDYLVETAPTRKTAERETLNAGRCGDAAYQVDAMQPTHFVTDHDTRA